MTPSPRSTAGLVAAAAKSRADARAKIRKAVREMKKKGLPINPNSVARYAGVARRTVYNHTDLYEEIKSLGSATRPQLAAAEPTVSDASSIRIALRNQLRAQKRDYDGEIAALKAQIAGLKQELAAAHGEIHRLCHQHPPCTGTPPAARSSEIG